MLQWLKAYFAAVIAGSILFAIAFPLMLGTLWEVSAIELLSLLAFSILTATAVALGPTIILYHLAHLTGWTERWVFVLAGMSIPIVGAAFVTSLGQSFGAALGGAFYGFLVSPCGAVAGFVFHRVLGRIDE